MDTAETEITVLVEAQEHAWELADACAVAVVTFPELTVKAAYAGELHRWVSVIDRLEQRRVELPDRDVPVRRPDLFDTGGLAGQVLAEPSSKASAALLSQRIAETGRRAQDLAKRLHPIWHGPCLRVIDALPGVAERSATALRPVVVDDRLPTSTTLPRRLEAGSGPTAPHTGSLQPARESAIAVEGVASPVTPLTLETRARYLHDALTGIEVGSLEICAQNVLVYRGAPLAFARDMARQAWDEGRHCAGLVERLDEIGSGLGAYPPVPSEVLPLIDGVTLPMAVCIVQRVGEWRGLEALFRISKDLTELGDERSAQLILAQAFDETLHVGFGNRWLKAYTGSLEETWEVHEAALALRTHRRRSATSQARPSYVPQWAAERAGFDHEELMRLGWKAPTAG